MLKQACSKLASGRPLMPACVSPMRYAMCQHQGGYSGQSPNKPATAAAPGVSLRVGSAAVSLRPGTAAAGAASGPSPPKSKAVPLAKRQKDVQVCECVCESWGRAMQQHLQTLAFRAGLLGSLYISITRADNTCQSNTGVEKKSLLGL